jgi:hypothetical protein
MAENLDRGEEMQEIQMPFSNEKAWRSYLVGVAAASMAATVKHTPSIDVPLDYRPEVISQFRTIVNVTLATARFTNYLEGVRKLSPDVIAKMIEDDVRQKISSTARELGLASGEILICVTHYPARQSIIDKKKIPYKLVAKTHYVAHYNVVL